MHLAEMNVGRLLYPKDDLRLADFMNNLELVNGLAERAPGFIWRYTDESGNATDTVAFEDPQVIVNLSVWENAAALEAFVFKTVHHKFYGRRQDWFDHAFGPALVLWEIEEGRLPTLEDALARYRRYAAEGPSPAAFGWAEAKGAGLWKTGRCAREA
jgi:hypothetical protein